MLFLNQGLPFSLFLKLMLTFCTVSFPVLLTMNVTGVPTPFLLWIKTKQTVE